MTQQWEEIDVPRGAYIGWGTTAGQHVTGNVLSFDATGGTDFNDNACPQLSVELTEQAASFNKEGVRTDFPAGELVVLNGGPVSLKRAMHAAALAPGDLVKIELTGFFKAEKGTGKEFSIKVARGAGKAAVPAPAAVAPAPAGGPWDTTATDDQPPF